MRTIHKYELSIVDEQVLALPRGFQVLHVEVQDSTPCLWVEVDTLATKVNVTLCIFGTGHILPEDSIELFLYHIGSFLQSPFVWHLYIKEEDDS